MNAHMSNEVMRNCLELLFGGFTNADIEFCVDLPGIGIDNFRLVMFRGSIATMVFPTPVGPPITIRNLSDMLLLCGVRSGESYV
jgi:hypothetical protein